MEFFLIKIFSGILDYVFIIKELLKRPSYKLKISKLTSNKNSYVLFKSLLFDIEHPFSSPANYLNHNETYGWLLFHTPFFLRRAYRHFKIYFHCKREFQCQFKSVYATIYILLTPRAFLTGPIRWPSWNWQRLRVSLAYFIFELT